MKKRFFAARAASVRFITCDPMGRIAVGHKTRNAAMLRMDVTPGLTMRGRSIGTVTDMRTGLTSEAPTVSAWLV